ncbi:MAG: hypothetical protein ACRDPF_08210, partial [Streptosporangiaceae bacterium]
YLPLDSQQQLRYPLDLIDHQQAVMPDESAGICLGSGADCLVVQVQFARADGSGSDQFGQVLFPTCLAPLTTTTRVSVSASAVIRSACREKRPAPASMRQRYRRRRRAMGDLPLPSWAVCRTGDGHSAGPILGGLPLLQPMQQAISS